MDNKNDVLSFLNDKASVSSAKSRSKSSKKSKPENVNNEVLSEDISLSQLELMANKKKLNKKSAEFSVSHIASENAKDVDNKIPEQPVKTKRSVSSMSSVSSSMSSDYQKRKQRTAKKENRHDNIRKEKLEYLYKLDKIGSKNKWRVSKMDMNNTLDDIRNEYEKILTEMKTDRTVGFYKRMLLLGVQGIEMINNRFDPLGIGEDLDGWSEAMGYSLENQEYDEVIAELYEKYKGTGNMSPELKLIFMIISSATMFTISKKITKLDSSNAFSNIIGSFVGAQAKPNIPQPTHVQSHYSETTEDLRPSRMKAPPADDIDISNILKTMNERKREKEQVPRSETSDDVFKSIPNLQKKGRGRPRKAALPKM
jgi:hypothetical protein